MSQSRNLKRKAASSTGYEQPIVNPAPSPQSEREDHTRENQEVSARVRRLVPSTATTSSRAATKNKRRVDPHLLRLSNEGIDPNTAFVDRTRFVHAPDPDRNPEAARAFAAVVADRAPQPSRRPLACVDSSEVKPEVLYAMDAWIYEGAGQPDCIPGYVRYGGHSEPNTSNRGAIISKQIKAFAWVWYEEENAVAPWKALGSEARGIVMRLGLSQKNFPILRYTSNEAAQDPPVQRHSEAGRATVPARIPNQHLDGATTPSIRQPSRVRKALPRNTEVESGNSDHDDEATGEDESEEASTLRRSSVGRAAGTVPTPSLQPGSATYPAVRRTGRTLRILPRNMEAHHDSGNHGRSSLVDRLNKGVFIDDFVRARADTSGDLFTLRIRNGHSIEEVFISMQVLDCYTDHVVMPGTSLSLSARNSSAAWVFANSFSSLQEGGPRPELPAHEVRFHKDDVDEVGNLRAEALHATPIDWTPQRLLEQYRFYKRMSCRPGRDMVVDWFYRRYSQKKLAGQEIMADCDQVLDGLEWNDFDDRKFRQLILNLIWSEDINHSIGGEYCALYHTHGDTMCYKRLASEDDPESNVEHLYTNFVRCKRDRSAVEHLHKEKKEVLALYKAERVQRDASLRDV